MNLVLQLTLQNARQSTLKIRLPSDPASMRLRASSSQLTSMDSQTSNGQSLSELLTTTRPNKSWTLFPSTVLLKLMLMSQSLLISQMLNSRALNLSMLVSGKAQPMTPFVLRLIQKGRLQTSILQQLRKRHKLSLQSLRIWLKTQRTTLRSRLLSASSKTWEMMMVLLLKPMKTTQLSRLLSTPSLSKRDSLKPFLTTLRPPSRDLKR